MNTQKLPDAEFANAKLPDAEFANAKLPNARFTEAIEHVRKTFKLKHELPFGDYPSAMELIDRANNITSAIYANGIEINEFVHLLPIKILDSIWHAIYIITEEGYFPGNSDNDKLFDILLKIIEVRITKRLFMIGWYTYQYAHENRGLAKALMVGLAKIDNYIPDITPTVFNDDKEGLLRYYVDTLHKKDNVKLKYFMEVNFLLENSPFVKQLYKMYFLECTEDVYNNNEDEFIWLINSLAQSDIGDIIANYLKLVSLENYLVRINETIINKLGVPKPGEQYYGIVSELAEKLRKWHILRNISLFYGDTGIKYRVYSLFYEHMHNVEIVDDNQLMLIDFDTFVVVDGLGMSNLSYLYEKNTFSKHINAYDTRKGSLESWLIPTKRIPEARDAIIEEVSNNIYSLVFFEFGKLYARDLLNHLITNKHSFNVKC